MSKYLLSISIPTRNRSQYICHVATQLLLGMPETVEIVVSDNSDEVNEELKNHSFKNSRLVYLFESEPLYFSDNFNRSLKACRGEFVTAIGDDDFVLPWIIDYLEFAKANDVDSLVYDFDAVYYWPGVKGRTNDNFGMLRIAKRGEFSARPLNQSNVLKEFLLDGLSNYSESPLARIYHGVVSSSLVRKVIDTHGSLYGGLSPDIYSSIMLSNYSQKSFKCGVSLTMPGICGVSGSGQSASGSHRGSLSVAPHFRGNAGYVWNQRVPYFYSVNTIWFESGLRALSAIDDDLLNRISYNKFLGRALIENLQISAHIASAMRDLKRINAVEYSLIRVLCYSMIGLFSKVLKKFKRSNQSLEFVKCDSIQHAVEYFSEVCRYSSWRLQKRVKIVKE